MSKLSVTVVVPAYNCKKTIRSCLQAIIGQTYPVSKIVIVDDGSKDQTPEIVKVFKNVVYLRQDNAGPAAARNRGAQEAQTDIIFFTDSDCIPEKNWIETSIKHFDDLTVGAVAGSYGIANKESLLAQCIHDEIIFRHEHLFPKFVKSFGSYNVGIRKNIFEKVAGFDVGYRFASGEDNDLSYKILKAGFKIYFEKDSKVGHFHTNSVKKYLREQSRHGFWRAKMYFDHPDMMKGDDYTFWKDMIEVPWSLAICLFFWGALLGWIKSDGLLLAALSLFGLEFYFAFLITQKFFAAIFYGFVMGLRALARTFGFSSGIFQILLNKMTKKNK